jgi:hypothetical protein
VATLKWVTPHTVADRSAVIRCHGPGPLALP